MTYWSKRVSQPRKQRDMLRELPIDPRFIDDSYKPPVIDPDDETSIMRKAFARARIDYIKNLLSER